MALKTVQTAIIGIFKKNKILFWV